MKHYKIGAQVCRAKIEVIDKKERATKYTILRKCVL